MNTKLTLNIDKFIVEKAKEYARKNGKSLSKIIEGYLRMVTNKSEPQKDLEISPRVKSLMGVIKLPEDFDYRKELTEILADKHK